MSAFGCRVKGLFQRVAGLFETMALGILGNADRLAHDEPPRLNGKLTRNPFSCLRAEIKSQMPYHYTTGGPPAAVSIA